MSGELCLSKLCLRSCVWRGGSCAFLPSASLYNSIRYNKSTKLYIIIDNHTNLEFEEMYLQIKKK